MAEPITTQFPAQAGEHPGDGTPLPALHETPTDLSYDPGFAAHQAAEKHVEACQQVMFELDDGAEFEDVLDPSSAPYCGCTTCDVREILHAAWPIMEAHFRQKYGIPAGAE
jgi:hypothetical protein